jgi:8-oxo-dGTP pyrophosphatase MutT (NUDIX family)
MNKPNVKNPIKPASTLLLVREKKDTPFEVFMVLRHHQIDVAAGALVFPGGKVEDQDSCEEVFQRCATTHLTNNILPFAVGVIREVFEETGVLLARQAGESALINAQNLLNLEHYRDKLVKESVTLADMLEKEDLELATDLLLHYAHWITPDMAPKRFDTHFFIARAPEDQVALHDGEESVDSVWISPSMLLKEAGEGKWKIVFPTKMNTEKLAVFKSYSDIESYLAKNTPVTVQPEYVSSNEGKFLCIPKEADYPRWKVSIEEVMTP